MAYFKEWEETTVLAEQEGRRKMTLLTMLAFLPNFIKFYLVGGVAGAGVKGQGPGTGRALGSVRSAGWDRQLASF